MFCQPTALYCMFEYCNLLMIGRYFKGMTCVCMSVCCIAAAAVRAPGT